MDKSREGKLGRTDALRTQMRKRRWKTLTMKAKRFDPEEITPLDNLHQIL